VGWRSGFTGLLILFVTALFLRAPLTGTDALTARGFLNSVAISILIGLVSYNATRVGELRGTPLVNALLVGLVISVALEFAIFSSGSALSSGSLPIGRPVSYLAAVGLALCFARIVSRDETGAHYHPVLHIALGTGFLMAMFPGLQRGAWLSAIIAVLYISLRARKKQYLLLIVLGLTLILAQPVARERVVPSSQLTSIGGYTTGRVDLWRSLWKEIESGLPLGNGFGHTFTLTSEDLFGKGNISFNPEGATTFVYPHNDFLFWMVELGILGLLGMVTFWAQLLRALRSVLRSRSIERHNVMALSGVVITAFIVQMVGSTFFFLPLASVFLISAGFIFGTREAIAATRE
jgi:O-antigen ligase